MPSTRIRLSDRSPDFSVAVEIEATADELLIDFLRATDWPPVDSAQERMALPGFLLIAEDDSHHAVGFAHVLELDGFIHLEQLAVRPANGRRGVGRMLVDAVLTEAAARGYSEITLRAYRNVPWNAPFYETCGFSRSEPHSAFHLRLLDVETRLELDKHGERIQMTAQLGPTGRRTAPETGPKLEP
ncbi:GNAT family N-acetyltransferase [Microbacterium aerolatum]|uniref:GNAT family N-acetyltransferase n=1 Tax=Microbacterium aerolatum TaxID=153731 RepID=UPI002001612F|nr:GNAT family N-acetyltransferase [Microbacterium aerolatum]MCK3770529.1 GNAT family N-acetyltransferase [Microbacterium aerolatum]